MTSVVFYLQGPDRRGNETIRSYMPWVRRTRVHWNTGLSACGWHTGPAGEPGDEYLRAALAVWAAGAIILFLAFWLNTPPNDERPAPTEQDLTEWRTLAGPPQFR